MQSTMTKTWTVRQVRVTPEIARTWLLRNKNPRKLRPHHVAFLCRVALSGAWGLDVNAIVFDWNGHLINGQHRLTMIAQTGIPQVFIVVEGADPEIAKHIDSGGMNRSMGDIIKMIDPKAAEPSIVAAVCSLVWRYQNTSLMDAHRIGGHEVSKVLSEHPGVVRSVSFIRGNLPCPKAPLAFVHYAAWTGAPVEADAWANAVTRGNTGLTCPARVLREYLLKNSQSWLGTTMRNTLMRGLVRCWNGFIDGERMERFQMFTRTTKIHEIRGCLIGRSALGSGVEPESESEE